MKAYKFEVEVRWFRHYLAICMAINGKSPKALASALEIEEGPVHYWLACWPDPEAIPGLLDLARICEALPCMSRDLASSLLARQVALGSEGVAWAKRKEEERAVTLEGGRVAFENYERGA